ncbi:MAG: chitobiase/beta-hexosaminidase C-terminal domain-containing protein, partial [Bacteroidota bacterium]
MSFSSERGYYDTFFQLSLTASDPNAIIRYTVDGSAPGPNHGLVYNNPLLIGTTTCIRAYASTADTFSTVKTHTYLFLNDVVNQSNSIASQPQSGLEFDASLKNDPIYGAQLMEGLVQIPSVSLVLDPADLSNVYTSTDRNLEVPVSMEVMYPDGKTGFQENAGMKRVGGSSYNSIKRNWRLVFRNVYGASKLNYPIFGDDGADEHDQIALRP